MSGFHSDMIELMRSMGQHLTELVDAKSSLSFSELGGQGDDNAGMWSKGFLLKKDPATGFLGDASGLAAAIGNAEFALRAFWESSRQQQDNALTAQSEFIRSFEKNTQEISRMILKISQGIEAGAVRRTPRVSRLLRELQNDAALIVTLYEKNGHHINSSNLFGDTGQGFGNR